MMPERRRVDTPNWAITLAENVQQLQDISVVKGLINVVAGSSSPAYKQARWHNVEEVIAAETGEPTALPVVEADPEAPVLSALIPRLKKNAVILEAGEGLIEASRGHKGPRKAVVAYTYKEKTHVGDSPGEIVNFETHLPNTYRAAMRSGRNNFGAAIGIWLLGESVFILPEDGQIIEENVPINILGTRYPGISLF
jgi:hypothetical protein